MNRQIKFRGKEPDNGEWVYGSLMIWSDDDTTILIPSAKNQAKNIPVLRDSVGQFTGLTDCNGTDIYEGDILSNGSGQTMTVIFDTSRCGFMGETDHVERFQTTSRWLLPSLADSYEVIGTVHDQKGGPNANKTRKPTPLPQGLEAHPRLHP